jgi:hypothetical protein
MAKIPNAGDAPLIRTNFSNEAAWDDLVRAAQTPSSDGFQANLQVINDVRFDGVSPEQIGSAARGTDHAVIFIADELTMGHEDLPVLCLDASAPEQTFRVIPSELWSVENNLSLANMDFEEFADAAGAEGVFRGF